MEPDDQQEQDNLDAIYAQQEGENRQEWEARIRARGERVQDEFRRECREWFARGNPKFDNEWTI